MVLWHVFLPAAALMALIPGANQLLGLRNAALVGVRYALAGVAGRFTAFAVLIALATLGLGTLLARSAVAFEVIRWAGVAYLLWLGLVTWRNAGRVTDDATNAARDRPLAVVRQEFLTALTNPKALLLFASFLPQFMPADAAPATLVLLAAVYVGVEALAALVYLAVGRSLRTADGRLRLPRRRLDRLAGAGFIGFAGYLTTVQRPV